MRLLTPSDIPRALQLSEAAGWNQTAADWTRYLALAPGSVFGVEADGVLASTGGAIYYGRELAWLGMVLTLPEFRGRGYARQILEHTLEYLDQRGNAAVRLDGTEHGQPLYRTLGFADEYPVERWMRLPAPAESIALPPFVLDGALDREAFGADRMPLLRLLASEEGSAIPGGFALGRPGRVAAFFGPCVSRSAESARAMARWFVGRHCERSIYWDLTPDHAATSIAKDLGFAPQRKLTRMVRGAQPSSPSPLVYGLAGFEFG